MHKKARLVWGCVLKTREREREEKKKMKKKKMKKKKKKKKQSLSLIRPEAKLALTTFNGLQRSSALDH